jgi:hypothetical protein
MGAAVVKRNSLRRVPLCGGWLCIVVGDETAHSLIRLRAAIAFPVRLRRKWVQTMKRSLVFAVAALVVAGCGGNGSSAPTTSPVAATTAATVDTTTSTTTPATNTTTVVAASTTTLSPETTTTVATEDLIKQAVQDYTVAYHECGAAPADCHPENFTSTHGHSRSIITELATGMAQQGLYFSTDERGSYLVAESVTIVSPTEATAIFCAYDAGTVLGPNGPDGLPTVVNDESLSIKNEYHLYLEQSGWLTGEQQQIEAMGQGNMCPPAE